MTPATAAIAPTLPGYSLGETRFLVAAALLDQGSYPWVEVERDLLDDGRLGPDAELCAGDHREMGYPLVTPTTMMRYLVVQCPGQDKSRAALTRDTRETLMQTLDSIGRDEGGDGEWLVACFDLDERRNMGITLTRTVTVTEAPEAPLADADVAPWRDDVAADGLPSDA